ncbi:MAG: ABC transporter ATP-binding protein [Candidatus Omnitrophica bacterium]|nr:ABC transporter ATP-binding protein [Candidatus Omnitrophota bacterium]
MSEPIFELKNIHYSYLGKYPALCGIDMTVKQGEKIAFIGANGSGKSTLLRILDGLIFPDSGVIKAFGKELNEDLFSLEDFSSSFRKKVGLLFQNPDVQLFCPTVKEDIVFGPLQLGVSRQEADKRLDEITTLFNINDLLNRAPHQLSIGEKRKVAIASTLVIDPDILLLDEPTAGLDPQTARQIIDIIIEANEKGKTIITATHDLHIVEEIADTVYILSRDKKIASFGASRELLADTALLQNHNLVHIHRHRHKDEIHIHPHQHLEHHL